jgi:hypothetical protein
MKLKKLIFYSYEKIDSKVNTVTTVLDQRCPATWGECLFKCDKKLNFINHYSLYSLLYNSLFDKKSWITRFIVCNIDSWSSFLWVFWVLLYKNGKISKYWTTHTHVANGKIQFDNTVLDRWFLIFFISQLQQNWILFRSQHCCHPFLYFF